MVLRNVELDVLCVAMEIKTWRQMILPRGKMYKMKSSGPSTKSWGTPSDRGAAEEVLLLILMNCCRSLRYDFKPGEAGASDVYLGFEMGEKNDDRVEGSSEGWRGGLSQQREGGQRCGESRCVAEVVSLVLMVKTVKGMLLADSKRVRDVVAGLEEFANGGQ